MFYSPLQRVIEQKMPKAASAQQVLNIVKGGGPCYRHRKEKEWLPVVLTATPLGSVTHD